MISTIESYNLENMQPEDRAVFAVLSKIATNMQCSKKYTSSGAVALQKDLYASSVVEVHFKHRKKHGLEMIGTGGGLFTKSQKAVIESELRERLEPGYSGVAAENPFYFPKAYTQTIVSRMLRDGLLDEVKIPKGATHGGTKMSTSYYMTEKGWNRLQEFDPESAQDIAGYMGLRDKYEESPEQKPWASLMPMARRYAESMFCDAEPEAPQRAPAAPPPDSALINGRLAAMSKEEVAAFAIFSALARQIEERQKDFPIGSFALKQYVCRKESNYTYGFTSLQREALRAGVHDRIVDGYIKAPKPFVVERAVYDKVLADMLHKGWLRTSDTLTGMQDGTRPVRRYHMTEAGLRHFNTLEPESARDIAPCLGVILDPSHEESARGEPWEPLIPLARKYAESIVAKPPRRR